jgi:hypothetical protein
VDENNDSIFLKGEPSKKKSILSEYVCKKPCIEETKIIDLFNDEKENQVAVDTFQVVDEKPIDKIDIKGKLSESQQLKQTFTL